MADERPEPQDEQKDFIPAFIAESEEHLTVLNEQLLAIESALKQGGEISTDIFNVMFRAVHTIKGTASFIDLHDIIDISHKMETLLQRMRDKEMPCTNEIVDALFSATDTLSGLIKQLKKKNPKPVDIQADLLRLGTLLDGPGEESADVPDTNTLADPEKVDEKYVDQFIVEIGQDIDDLHNTVLDFEQGGSQKEAIDGLLRKIHDIKSKSGVLNIAEFKKIAHTIENLVIFFRDEGRDFDGNSLKALSKAISSFKELIFVMKTKRTIDMDVTPLCLEIENYFQNMLSEKGTGSKNEDQESVQLPAGELTHEKLIDIDSLSDAQLTLMAEAIETGKQAYQIVFTIEAAVHMKSIKSALIEERLGKSGQVISIRPGENEIEESRGDVAVGVIYCSDCEEKDIRSMILADGVQVVSIARTESQQDKGILEEKGLIKEEPKVKEQNDTKGAAMAESAGEQKAPSNGKKSAPIDVSIIRVDSRKLDNLMNLSGELVIIRAQYARLVNLFTSGLRMQKDIISKIENSVSMMGNIEEQVASDAKAETDDKGRAMVLKNLTDLNMGLMEISKKIKEASIVENIFGLDETTNTLEKISAEIQSGVMQTRMIPIEGVFTRFNRTVRDIAKELGKEVDLAIEGEDTELDKKIVDELGDPLTHMVRNAIDHGIEDKDERLKAGKKAQGRLLLRAFHKGSHICIEVADDGKGIDPETFVKTALKKKLITQDEANQLNEKQKFDLMFLPGFSTNEVVTDLSGRGVGMDVVNTMINAVGGIIDIKSTHGQGTTFVLKIPLTLAIIQALLVQIGNEIYAFPVETITEIIKISSDEVYSIDGNDTVKLRGHALSLIDLHEVIKIKGVKTNDEEHRIIVIITDGKTRIGVVVDKLIGKEEIVIKSLSEHFEHIKGLTGASILADGRVALILDSLAIIKEAM